MFTDKQEQKQIRRLKEILFPKNKISKNQPLQSIQNHNNVHESKTRRQPTKNKRPLQNQNRSKSKTLKNTHQQQYLAKQNTYIRKNTYQTQINTQYQESQNQNQKHLIKHQIDKLKSQINNMLNKWNDQTQENTRRSLQNIKTHQTNQNISLFQSHHQQLTRQHYLKNINQISKNLQKYNAYMYGIKQATQTMISTIPLVQQNYLIKIQDIRAYKLYYLGKLLLAYFVQKIETLKKERLKSSWKNIIQFSQQLQEQRKKQKQQKAINKGNNLFQRKNLLDKAFKKWRTNSALIKFKQSLKEHTNSQNRNLQNHKEESSTSFEQLKEAQFLSKNILKKEKTVQYLQKYLLSVTEKLSKAYGQNQSIKNQNNNKNKGSQYYLNQQIEIVFIDQSNKKAFSYINSNDLLDQNLLNQVSQSRIENVLKSISQDNTQSKESFSDNNKSEYKKYSFGIKNSLTRMCIDSSKIIRVPEMKRNEVFSLQVDGSIGEQVWIRTAKTQRGQQKPAFNMNMNKQNGLNKNPIINEEVFYQQQSLIQQHGYKYECPSIKTSVIFYPLIHENSFVGMVRQYIYHSSPILLSSLQIPFNDLQFVTESIFTTFELAYSFQSLKKQRRLVEDGYALKVVKMIKKVENEVKNIIKEVQSEDMSESKINKKMMEVFSYQMRRFLLNRRQNDEKCSIKQDKLLEWGMKVYRVANSNRRRNIEGENNGKLLFSVDQQLRQEGQLSTQFEQIWDQSDKIVSAQDMIKILRQFKQISVNKQQSMSFKTQNIGEQKQVRIIMIKCHTSGQQMYFSFLHQTNNNSKIPSYIDKNTSQQIMIPEQLLIQIVNKFVSILNNTIDKCKLISNGLIQRGYQQRLNIKSQIKSNIRTYYLDCLKNTINIGNSINKQQQTSFIVKLNKFIHQYTNNLLKQITQHQRIQQRNILFRLDYTVNMRIPLYMKQIQSQSQSQCINIKVQLMMSNKKDANLQPKDVNNTNNGLQYQVKYQVLTQNVQQDMDQHNFSEDQNMVNLTVNSVTVLIQQNNKQQTIRQGDCLFSNQQIQIMLKETIQNFIQLSKQIYFRKYTIKITKEDSSQKQQQSVKNTGEQVLNKLLPQIKQKLFQMYLIKQDSIQTIKNNKYKNKSEQRFIQTIITVFKSILKPSLNLNQIEQQQIQIIPNKQIIIKLLNQSQLYIKNNSINQSQISCKYHQLLPNSTLQLLKNTLGCINNYDSIKENQDQTQENKNNNDLLQNVIKGMKYYQKYTMNINQNNTNINNNNTAVNETISMKDLISSSYFIVSNQQDNEVLITIKVNNLSHLSSKNISTISIIQTNFSTALQLMFNQYNSINKWQSGLNKINKIIKGINKLVGCKSIKQQQDINENQQGVNESEGQSKNQMSQQQTQQKTIKQYPLLHSTPSVLYSNLYQAFTQIKSHSNHIVYKTNKLISLSYLTNKYTKKTLINSLHQWKLISTHISNQQLTQIISKKILHNLQQYKSNITHLIDKVAKICCYDKILSYSIQKIHFHAKHSRIADFNSYRLKHLNSAAQTLTKIFYQNHRINMKGFFKLAINVVTQKRRSQIVMEKKMELFIVHLENSKIHKRMTKQSLKQGFMKMKDELKHKKSFDLQKDQKQQQLIESCSKQAPISLDEKLSRSQSLQEISEILRQQFAEYDIWVKHNKKIDEFIMLSMSPKQLKENDSLNQTKKNLSFDESSLVSSRIKDTLEKIKQQSHKLTKDQIYSLYQNHNKSNCVLETSNAIFISRDLLNTSSSASLIFSQTNLASNVVNLSTNNSSELSFKQKEKLNSLSKSLSQFFTHYKMQLNTKILYLHSLYETIKSKRYSFAMKKLKKHNENLLLIKTYQLTDHVYQLNIETDNIKQKIKQQDKQITENQNQFNKLIKKEHQHKTKIEKYQNNIEVLNKMLQFYNQIQKKEDDFLRSASKSSTRKFSKINSQYQGPFVELSALSHQEMSIVLLSLTRWRQINANEKLKQLRVNNFSKQVKIFEKQVINCSKSIKYNFQKHGFDQIISFSLIFKQQIERKRQQDERIRLILLERQKQRLAKENIQRLRHEKQRVQKQQRIQRDQQMEIKRKEKERIDMERMQQLFRNSALKSRSDLKDDKNRTWKSQKLTSTQKSLTMGQKTTQDHTKMQVSRNISQNQAKQLPQDTFFQSNKYQTHQYEFFTPNQTGSQSLADQLQSSFSELNKRLVTFQKNHLSPTDDNDDCVEPEAYFSKYEISEIERQTVGQQIKQYVPLQQSKAPNNTMQIMPQVQKMTEAEKIKFELERMRMKKLQFNKQNLTVTQQQYESLNGGNGYKLGGKTLRFLKRMGKLQTTDRQSK